MSSDKPFIEGYLAVPNHPIDGTRWVTIGYSVRVVSLYTADITGSRAGLHTSTLEDQGILLKGGVPLDELAKNGEVLCLYLPLFSEELKLCEYEDFKSTFNQYTKDLKEEAAELINIAEEIIELYEMDDESPDIGRELYGFYTLSKEMVLLLEKVLKLNESVPISVLDKEMSDFIEADKKDHNQGYNKTPYKVASVTDEAVRDSIVDNLKEVCGISDVTIVKKAHHTDPAWAYEISTSVEDLADYAARLIREDSYEDLKDNDNIFFEGTYRDFIARYDENLVHELYTLVSGEVCKLMAWNNNVFIRYNNYTVITEYETKDISLVYPPYLKSYRARTEYTEWLLKG